MTGYNIYFRKWLEENFDRVKKYQEASQLAQKEIDRLCEGVVSRAGVQSVRWENVWGNRHYIACLRTFSQLTESQPDRMRNTMEGTYIHTVLKLKHSINCQELLLRLNKVHLGLICYPLEESLIRIYYELV